jgi:hypothetical protein
MVTGQNQNFNCTNTLGMYDCLIEIFLFCNMPISKPGPKNAVHIPRETQTFSSPSDGKPNCSNTPK